MVMKRLNLPELTVVVVDCVARDLSAFALERTLGLINPGGLIIAADKYINHRPVDSAAYIPCKLNSISAVEEMMWYGILPYVYTSHILFIQYDGFVTSPEMWNPAWLNYDYIGAPWPWHEYNRVGNGGFSLRSVDLMKFLARNKQRFPVRTPEDDTLCRKHRSQLVTEFSFQWAAEAQAMRFSFERDIPHKAFGFHGIFNIPHVLDRPSLSEWVKLAPEYVRNKVEWKELELQLKAKAS